MRLSDGIIPHTEQWEQMRLKRITASYINKIFVSGRSKSDLIGVGGLTYIHTKIGEILTGRSESEVPEGVMDVERGLALEPEARYIYAEITEQFVEDSLFFEYNKICGGTNDGIVCYEDTDVIKSVLEIKCPRAHKHIKLLKVKSAIELKDVDPQYYHQLQANILFAEAEYGDFCSYNEDIILPEARLKIVRVYPDMDWRKEFVTRIDWIAEYIEETITEILKTGERNLAYRYEKSPKEILKLQSAIEGVSQLIKP
jgi:hypothetical protein